MDVINVLAFAAFGFYMLPLIVAFARNHRNTPAIGLLTIFLGWTLIGWVGALIWATLHQPQATATE